MLYSGVLEFSQEGVIKTCFVMCVKRWFGVEMKVEVVFSVVLVYPDCCQLYFAT